MERITRVEQHVQPFGDTTHTLNPQHLHERMRFYGVPGVSVVVIDNETLVWAKAFGVYELTCATPVTPETRFPAASISKPIVAMAVLRLVQDSVLDLDTDVNRYLTSWKVPPSPYTQQHAVTLRRLLSHSAGTTVYGFWGYRPLAPVPTLLQVLDGLAPANTLPVRVDVTSGSRWRYSGGGYCIVQQLLIDVLGKSFPDLMHELVLAPLGMTASAFSHAPAPAWWPITAHGHDATGAPIAERWRVHPELAAGGLWSTPTDLTKFVIDVQQSQHGWSNKVLRPETMAHTLSPQIINWALGPAIDGEGEVARFAHGGAKVGFRCYMVAYCQRGQGAVVMTNGECGDHLCVEVLHRIARAYDWPEYYHYLDRQS